MRRLVLAAAAALLVLLLFLAARGGSAGDPSASGSAPISPGSEAAVLTKEEALARVQEHFGERDETTGNLFSIGFENMVNVDGADCYNFRVSWLVDGDHLSYLTNYIVSLDGSIMQEYLPDSPAGGSVSAEPRTAREAADSLFDLLRLNPGELKDFIDPERGLTFTPCLPVSESNRTVTAEEFSTFFSDKELYTWGSLDNQAVSLTGGDYWTRFVWDEDGDYFTPDTVEEGKLTHGGEQDLSDVYPDCAFVDYCFAGSDGADSFSLTLVLRQVENTWYLRGLVHSQWAE
ncbi:hypothetical protein KQI82_14350 [Oscillibacter sp. MSJ-2]|uniref:PepSY domain-containing protein n=1 Tax=Dysosmobacter acutus TaxID=2841504 RepID=A0ABS6FFE9_9FIRM|nr:hypothetical protein [Dysosmobacter acutus]MBU5628090.1 hypothetical protein [Dysosmobacter acutus]